MVPIKPSQIVKNFVKRVGFEGFKRYANRVKDVIRQPPSGLNYSLLHNGDYLINEELNRLIYPYWYNIPYQYKAINMILYEKEIWFIGKMNNEEQAKNWKAITQKVLEITKTDYKKQSFFNNAIFVSKLYNLGK